MIDFSMDEMLELARQAELQKRVEADGVEAPKPRRTNARWFQLDPALRERLAKAAKANGRTIEDELHARLEASFQHGLSPPKED